MSECIYLAIRMDCLTCTSAVNFWFLNALASCAQRLRCDSSHFLLACSRNRKLRFYYLSPSLFRDVIKAFRSRSIDRPIEQSRMAISHTSFRERHKEKAIHQNLGFEWPSGGRQQHQNIHNSSRVTCSLRLFTFLHDSVLLTSFNYSFCGYVHTFFPLRPYLTLSDIPKLNFLRRKRTSVWHIHFSISRWRLRWCRRVCFCEEKVALTDSWTAR
jgi:hypothetical protein